MKVMVIVKASPESEAGIMPTEQLLTDMGKFNEELAKAGMMLAGDGLQPSSKGARVRFSGKNRTVIDGPFSETKELIAGYWVWKVKSLAEAIEWVKRCPNPMLSDSEIEIRPLFEMEDFGEAATPQVRELHEQTRAIAEQACQGGPSSATKLASPRFEQRKEFLVSGMNESYTDETRKNIPAQWQGFAPHIGKVPGQQGMTSYGVCWKFEPGCKFDYLCGVEVSQGSKQPADFTQVTIPAQRYAVFTHTGHYSEIPHTIQAIFGEWEPKSGQQVAQTPCFERYTEEFDPKTGRGGTEIWIPLKN